MFRFVWDLNDFFCIFKALCAVKLKLLAVHMQLQLELDFEISDDVAITEINCHDSPVGVPLRLFGS